MAAVGYIDSATGWTTGEAMIRRLQAPQPRSARPWPKQEVFVSDCCNAVADDFFQNIKRCPECKESCSFEEVG
jgi:hypothetical protein